MAGANRHSQEIYQSLIYRVSAFTPVDENVKSGGQAVLWTAFEAHYSQQRLAALIDSLPGIVFICDNDPEWSMLYLSQGCRALTGYHSDELAGKRRTRTYNSICHPDDQPRVTAAIAQAIAQHKPYVVEYRIRTKTGQEKWLWEKGHGIYAGDGQVLSIEGFISDISERKRVEAALQEKEEFLRLILDNIPQYIFWKDLNSVYQGCNRSWAIMAGLENPEQAIGLTDYDLPWKPEEAEIYRACDRQVLDLDQPLLRQLQSQRRADGKQTWCEVSKLPLHDAVGNVIGLLGTVEDVTERKAAEEALLLAEQKYRSIFENAVEGIFQTTENGHYLTANPMLAKIYGYDSPADLMANLVSIEQQLYVDSSRRQDFVRQVQEQGAVWGFESQIYRKDGSIIWISENARAIWNEAGELLGYEGTVEDITVRKQAEQELHQRDSLLQGVAEATNYLLTNTDTAAAITQALAVLGQSAGVDRVYIYENHPHSSTGEPAMSMQYEWVRTSILPSIQQPHWQDQPYSTFAQSRLYEILAEGRSISGRAQDFPPEEQKILQVDGIQSILLVPILIEDQFWGIIGFDDCRSERSWSKTEESILIAMAASIGGALKRQQAEATIRYQAFHDLLTGLPNRTLFNDRLPLALANAQRQTGLLAVMFLDLDRFKTINDTLGHAIGDLLLQAVAQRLSTCLREGDTIARWGGDEFTLLLPQIYSPEDAAKAAQRIIQALKPAFYLEGHELHISSSMGIAIYPQDGEDAQTLLKNADAALYRVKEQGRNGFQIYTPAINSKASELLALESSLYHALERQEFSLQFQPQLNTTTWQITRMEALVRWHHPSLGLISPRVFIPLAEENGLIVPIGEWVLRTACAQNKAWQDAGMPPLRIAVNLSARQFQEPGMVETISQILAETGLAPACLELEITETTAMQNVDFTSAVLQELHDMGVHISLDDFGTGYSSLGYLKKFPLDTIKIDQSFVRELPTDANDLAIVRAVIALGHGLDLSVVAEGVETREQMELLRSLHCEDMQGYLFSKPLPALSATQFLQTYSSQNCSLALGIQAS